ncbi:MAG: arginine--tRNA ligase [Patescibacteria group bacterium]
MKEKVRKAIIKAVKASGYEVPALFSVDAPPRPEFGDFATNAALMIAGSRPELIAREAADNIALNLQKAEVVAKAEVAGPGFINITLKTGLYLSELKNILERGSSYGRSGVGRGRKINVEYISANPTGPLHIGNARGGPIGEAVANLYEFLGCDVVREFYVNDVGGQIDRLAETLVYWYEVKDDDRIVFPEGGYRGDYIRELSEQIQGEAAAELTRIDEHTDLLKLFREKGLALLIGQIKQDIALLGINFDRWSYQSEIQAGGKSKKVISRLDKNGATIRREGALWFKNPSDPEFRDKESVLRKSDEAGTLTYFADDIAYHIDKFERGRDLLIDVWGANHHGHVPRLKAALGALGYAGERLNIILYQYVRLKNAGEVIKMGKRFGTFVTLRQIIEAGVAPDAFKYFILSQNPNTPMDFDLALARDTSEKNPVYYIKYAHARIASILRKAKQGDDIIADAPDLALLTNQKETALYKELVKFPELIAEIGGSYQIQMLCHYSYRLATLFHDFYGHCPVLSADTALSRARLALILATKTVFANALAILDIEAPERM